MTKINIFLRCVAIKIAVSIVSVDFDQQQDLSPLICQYLENRRSKVKDHFEIFFITILSLIVVLEIAFITHGIDFFNPTIIEAKMP